MRYCVDKKRLPPTLFVSPSEFLEGQFAGISAGAEELLAQFDMRIVAAEEALAVVQSTRNAEKIAIRATQRS